MYNFGNDALDAMQRQLEQMRNQTQIAQPSTNMVWVQGMEGAKGYQIPNRSNIQMMDSENENIMYIVSSDDVGMRKMRMYRYEEIEIRQPSQIDMDKYATKEDVRNIILEMFGTKEELKNEQPVS